MARPHLRADGIPTRSDQSLMSSVERTITHIILRVEEMGASKELTDAVVLLGRARDKIADYVEQETANGPTGSD
jgi:hypothetical protein